MALLTEDGVRALAGFKGHDGPVTSCYLDVDGSRYPRPQELEHQLATLVRRARERGAVHPSVEADLRHIAQHVHQGLDRAHVRGLAMTGQKPAADTLKRLAGIADPAPLAAEPITDIRSLAASMRLRAACDACHAGFMKPYTPPVVTDEDRNFDFDSVLPPQ